MHRERYLAYGLVIDSEVDLPELRKLAMGDRSAADVVIRVAPTSRDAVIDGADYGPFYRMSPGHIWFDVPDVAEFIVRDGNEIIVNPRVGVDDGGIRLFLLGSAFGAILSQREFLTLHGNAIRIGDHCMVCVGDSGAGKSTLAAGFMRRGFDILADDVVPIDSACRAIPGFPRIKLWGDAAEKLGIATHGLSRIRPEMEKYNVPLSSQSGEPALVRWIYVLTKGSGPGMELEPVRGAAKYKVLHDYTYRMEFILGMNRQVNHLRSCGELSHRIRVARLIRPERGFDLDGLIDCLILDMRQNA